MRDDKRAKALEKIKAADDKGLVTLYFLGGADVRWLLKDEYPLNPDLKTLIDSINRHWVKLEPFQVPKTSDEFWNKVHFFIQCEKAEQDLLFSLRGYFGGNQ